jgi:hypothetical protein
MRLLYALILINIVFTAAAQDIDPFDEAVPHHAIKFSPGHLLINYHPTIEFSYEQRIAYRWTIQGEYGHIVNIRSENGEGSLDTWDSDRKGFKSKLEARYYVLATPSGKFTWYTAAELYYNNFDYLKQKDTGYETRSQRVYHEEKGFSGKFGFLLNMGSFLLDVNSGLSNREIHYSKIDPIFGEGESFLNHPKYETSRTALGLVFCARVGYSF